VPTQPRTPRKPAAKPKAKPPAKAPARASLKLTVAALDQVGASRLAARLITQAEAVPVLARGVRPKLAGADGATRLAAEIDKRLCTIQRARGCVEWDKVRSLARASLVRVG
jgi:hypothetical protein